MSEKQLQAELAQLHAKLATVRELKDRELRRMAVQSVNQRPASLGLTMASLLVIATAVAGAVSLAVLLFANK